MNTRLIATVFACLLTSLPAYAGNSAGVDTTTTASIPPLVNLSPEIDAATEALLKRIDQCSLAASTEDEAEACDALADETAPMDYVETSENQVFTEAHIEKSARLPGMVNVHISNTSP